MRVRSNAERKALFSKLALGNSLHIRVYDDYARCGKFSISPDFSGLNRKLDIEMIGGIKRRLKEKSLQDFVSEPTPELDAGPFWSRVTTLFDKKDSYFSNNKFSSRFANRFPEDFVEGKSFYSNSAIKIDIDPVKYTNTIIIEEAIRNYEMNQSYYDKYGISKDDIIMIELAKNSLLGQETEKNNISDKEI